MKNVKVSPAKLSGNISLPPSKSAAHRAIICASLAKGKSVIHPVELSDDIRATIGCMKALGARAELTGDTLTVDGTDTLNVPSASLDCGESGSTLRFLIPVAAAGGTEAEFTGHGRLPQRPIGVFLDCLPEKGVQCTTEGGLPLKISGRLQSGKYLVPGDISSQFITGLLLALPMIEGDSNIILTSPLQSAGYIDMTLSAMRDFGVNVTVTEDGWHICGSQKYIPQNYTVEGDWSQAAFFMTAAALGGCITINNLRMDSRQGDKACLEVYSRLGADIQIHENGSFTVNGGNLRGTEINARDIPDMVPALAVCAAAAEGRTVIYGAERLRIKECDRLAAMTDGLTRLGADIRETTDGLIINGGAIHGGMADGYNDHRIVMSLACASAAADGDIIITGAESINKSYPSFFEDLVKLGGKADVIMG